MTYTAIALLADEVFSISIEDARSDDEAIRDALECVVLEAAHRGHEITDTDYLTITDGNGCEVHADLLALWVNVPVRLTHTVDEEAGVRAAIPNSFKPD